MATNSIGQKKTISRNKSILTEGDEDMEEFLSLEKMSEAGGSSCSNEPKLRNSLSHRIHNKFLKDTSQALAENLFDGGDNSSSEEEKVEHKRRPSFNQTQSSALQQKKKLVNSMSIELPPASERSARGGDISSRVNKVSSTKCINLYSRQNNRDLDTSRDQSTSRSRVYPGLYGTKRKIQPSNLKSPPKVIPNLADSKKVNYGSPKPQLTKSLSGMKPGVNSTSSKGFVPVATQEKSRQSVKVSQNQTNPNPPAATGTSQATKSKLHIQVSKPSTATKAQNGPDYKVDTLVSPPKEALIQKETMMQSKSSSLMQKPPVKQTAMSKSNDLDIDAVIIEPKSSEKVAPVSGRNSNSLLAQQTPKAKQAEKEKTGQLIKDNAKESLVGLKESQADAQIKKRIENITPNLPKTQQQLFKKGGIELDEPTPKAPTYKTATSICFTPSNKLEKPTTQSKSTSRLVRDIPVQDISSDQHSHLNTHSHNVHYLEQALRSLYLNTLQEVSTHSLI